MVQRAEKFFIFTWKEVIVITLVGVISMVFFFTLGLHYGKKIHVAAAVNEAIGKMEQSPESVPSRDILEQASRHALVATEDSIKSATQEELQSGGVKLEAPKQVDLPGNKTLVAPPSVKHKEAPKEAVSKDNVDVPVTHEEAEPVSHAKGKFGIQLGSFPSRADANVRVKAFAKRGVHSEIKVAIVGGVTRYRVVQSGFSTKRDAEVKAKELKRKGKIDGFVLIKL